MSRLDMTTQHGETMKGIVSHDVSSQRSKEVSKAHALSKIGEKCLYQGLLFSTCIKL